MEFGCVFDIYKGIYPKTKSVTIENSYEIQYLQKHFTQTVECFNLLITTRYQSNLVADKKIEDFYVMWDSPLATFTYQLIPTI